MQKNFVFFLETKSCYSAFNKMLKFFNCNENKDRTPSNVIFLVIASFTETHIEKPRSTCAVSLHMQ